MRIENESQWNTDDLRAIAERVVNQSGVKVGDNAMLIFKTCRSPKSRVERRDGKPDRGAHVGYYRGLYGGTVDTVMVVEIYSKDRLTEKNALERLASASIQDVVQDAAPDFIKEIAVAIRMAVARDYGRYSDRERYEKDYEWALKSQLRALPKMNRSPEIIKCKIAALETELAEMKRDFARRVEHMEGRIAAEKERLTKAGG